MHGFSWRRWLSSGKRTKKTRPSAKASRLGLEQLEPRLAPATAQWTGAGADDLWSTPQNWTGNVVPATNGTDDLFFPSGALRLSNANDLTNPIFKAISFSGSGYALRGGDLTLTSSSALLVNLANSTNTINLPIHLGGAAGNRQFVSMNGVSSVLVVSGQLLGTTGVELSKDGPGTLVLSADNSGFTGPISIVEGPVDIRNAKALGDGTSPTTVLSTVNKSGQLQVESVAGAINEPLILNGAGPTNDGALVNIAGNNTWSGVITLDSDATIGSRAGNLTIQGVITDTGAGHNLTKEGASKVILDPLGTASGNTYRGRTFVNEGTLSIRHSLALGNVPTPLAGINDTVVQSFPNRSGTLQLEFVANPQRIDPNATATGFTVPNELLILNGPGVEGVHVLPKEHIINGGGTVSGALNNKTGENTWQQDITLWSNDTSIVFDDRLWDWATVGIGAEAGTQLTVAGHVKDNLISGSPTLPTKDYSLIKTRPGRVIFVTSNSYRGRTEILEGYLNIRDSGALGASGSPRNNTVDFPQGTLELEADNLADSNPAGPAPDGTPHLNTDIVINNEQLLVMGNGAGGNGALRNLRGTNEFTGTVPLTTSIQRGTSRTPPPPPAPAVQRNPRIPTWYAVTFAGTGATVGVEPDQAPFGQFDLSQLTLSGQVSGANLTKVGQGELVLADSANTYTGSTFILEGWITVRNSRSLGADVRGPDTVQPPTYVAEGGALHLKRSRFGQIIDVYERLFISGNGITHRFPELNQRGALLNLSGDNLYGGIINLVATNNFPQIGIGADIANSRWVPDDQTVTQSSLTIYNMIQEQLSNQANLLIGIQDPPTTIPAGINKLGRKRVNLQGPGTFSGDNQVSEGVLRIQNDLALGMISGTTTVTTAAALETKGYANTPGLGQTVDQFASNVIDFSSEWTPSPGPWSSSQAVGPPDTFQYGDIPSAWSALNTDGPPDPEYLTLGYATPVFASAVTVRETFNNGFVFQIDVLGVDNVFRTVWTGFDPSQAGAPVDFTVTFPQTNYLVKGVKVYVNPRHVQFDWEEIDAVELHGDTPPPLYNNTLNGGLFGGIQIRENLVLNGAGNTTTNDPTHNFSSPVLDRTLTSIADDNQWRGPITFSSDVGIDTKTDSRLSLWKTIDGPGGFSKDGLGKLVLGGVNTYVGVTNILQGTVNLQSSNALGAPGSGVFVTNGAELELQGDITIAGKALTVLGSGPTAPNIPVRWFGQGPGPIQNGQTIGNQDVTGRVSGLAVDPVDSNVMYLSAGGGGAWRSRNGGFTWEQLVDNVPGLTVDQIVFTGAIAVAPTDSNFIYVGLGESVNSGDAYYGRGVLKSTDRGRTWTLIQPPNAAFNRDTISKIVVDPVNPDIIYIALQGNGINDDPKGTYGIWRYEPFRAPAQQWMNLTQQTPSPTDNTAILFDPTIDHFTDLVVINSNPRLAGQRFPSEPNRRIISFAIGNIDGFSQNLANAVYTAIDANTNVDFPNWTLNGFPIAPEEYDGCTFHWIGVPRNGLIKEAATRNQPGNNQLAASANPAHNIVFYAAISHGVNAARADQMNADGNCGTDGTFREIQTATATYDYQTDLWTMGGWGALSVQPGVQNSPAQGYMSSQGWYDSVIAVQPGNSSYVFVAGVGQPFVSGPWVYDGTAWTDIGTAGGKAPHVDYHAVTWDGPPQQTGSPLPAVPPRRLLVGNDGGIWRLENTTPPSLATAQWTDLNGNFLQISTFNGLDVHPSNPFFAVGGTQDNGTEIYNDSPYWTQVEPGDGGIVRINNKNPDIMYHVLNGTLRRSLTGGAQGSWTTIYNTFLSTLYFPFILDRTNPSRLLVADADSVTRSLTDLREAMNADSANPTFNLIANGSNLGFGWIAQIAVADRQGQWQIDNSFPLVVDKGAETYDSDTIYVASTAGVHVTKNHGITWVTRNNGLDLSAPFDAPFPAPLADIAVDPRNRDTAYVVRNVFGGGHVFKTDNAGISWTDISGDLPDVPTWKVVVNARNGDIYVGTDNGVYVLPRGLGANWSRLGIGLPNTQVKELVFNPVTNMLSAGTYGRGLYQVWLDDSRNNGGGIRVVSGSSVWTGPITLTGDVDFRAETGAQLTILGQVKDDVSGANHQINKVGLGRYVFAGDNTYGGVTDIQEGALVVRHPHALGQITKTANTIVEVGAALEMQADLEGARVQLNGNGASFNGHFTGALRNVSNNNTFTGTITLNTQVPGPSNNNPLPSDTRLQITIGVDSGSQLTIGTKPGLTGTGTIVETGGPRNLTKELTGTLILNSGNSYTGFTQINQGILRIEHGGALGPGSDTEIRDGSQLQINKDTSGNPIAVVGELLQVSGTGIFGTGAVVNVAGSNTWQGPVLLQSITALPAPPPPTPPNFVSIGVNNAADALTIDGSVGQVGGSFGLTKLGPGKLVLKQADTYSGPTNIVAGVLNIQNGQALGTPGGPAANGTLVNPGAALEIQSTTGITITGETVTINGDGIGNTGAIRNVQGTNTWAGPVVLATSSSIGADAASQLTISGGVNSADTIELRKVGAGTVVFPTANPNLLGPIQVNGGVLNIRNPNALGPNVPSPGTGAPTTVNTGATLQVQGGITVRDEDVTINGPGFNNAGALENISGNNTWAHALHLGSDSSIGVTAAANTLVFNQPIDDAAAIPGRKLTKVGPGTLDYKVANTYTGLTTVADGTLLLDNATGTVFPGNLTVGDGIGAADSAVARWLFVDELQSTSTVTVNGDGNADLNNLSQTNALLKLVDGHATTGAAGTGQWTVNALDMTGGIFTIGAAGSQLILKGNVTATSSAAGTPLIQANGGVLSLGGGTRTFTVNDGPNVRDLRVTAPISGTGAEGLTKAGAGLMQVDSTTNPYTGITTISAGTLQVDGVLGNIMLNGGTLSGTGQVGTIAADAANGGTVNPGDVPGPGIVNSGNTVFNNKSTLFLDILSPSLGIGYDRLAITGTAQLGGASLAGVVDSSIQINDSFTILTATGGVSGQFNQDASGNAFLGGKKFHITYHANDVTITRIKNSVTVAVSSSANPSVYGQVVTFTATVTGEPAAGISPTGIVTFTLDGNNTNKILDANGQATLTPPTLTVGAHTLSVSYLGDSDFNGGSATLTPDQQVDQAITTTTISSSANPSVWGQDVTITATANPVAPAAGTPTGFMTFTVDGQTGTPQAMSGGRASITLSGLSIRQHIISATYSGDGNFLPSASSNFTQTVTKADVNVAPSSTPNPSTFGQQATFNVTVTAAAPGAGQPTGSVTFLDGAANLGTVNLVNGSASFQISSLTAGSHNISAVYSGDANFKIGSRNFTHTVNKSNTTTTVSASPSSTTYGQTVTFTATVAAIGPGAGTPTRDVTFIIDGAAQTPNVNLDNTGKATFATSTLSGGVHTIQVAYNGDPNFNTSNSSLMNYTVNKAGTTTSINSSINPSVAGQPVTFTATIVTLSPGVGTATGTVTFIIDNTSQTPDSAVDGQGHASFTTNSLAAGTHTVVARYNGNANFQGSSATLSPDQRVDQSNTTTTVTSSTNPSVFGQPVTFTATVAPNFPSTGIPAGNVRFFVDAAAQSPDVALDATGKATITLNNIAVGTHVIRADYQGNADYLASTGKLTPDQSVIKADTNTVLTTSNANAVYGEAVIVATVTAQTPSTATPAGSVTFQVNGAPYSTVNLDASGKATLAPPLDVGTYVISADYNGNTNFNVSSSNSLNQVVTKANTTTVLTTSNPNAVYGEPVIKATVTANSPSNTIPSGNVTFFITSASGTNSVTIALDPTGVAVLQPPLDVGVYTQINALYQGTGNFNQSASGNISQIIRQAATTTSVASSKNPSVFGQQVTFTVTVAANTPSTATPNGNVTFILDSTPQPAQALDSSGKATFTPSSTLSVGTHTVSVTYAGTTNFITSSGSLSGGQVVTKSNSQVAVSATPSPSTFGQSVTFTATVSALSPGAGTPTGTVTFTIDGVNQNPPRSLDPAGQATFSTSTLDAGNHTITVSYSGDGNFTTSTSPNFTQTVNKASTQSTVTSSPNPSTYGQPITFSATVVTVAPGAGTPTGNVRFLVDGAALSPDVTLDGAGKATLSTSGVTAGSHTLTVSFLGSANFNSSNSSGITQTVNKAGTATTLGSSANPSSFGQAVTFTATVTANSPSTATVVGNVRFSIDGVARTPDATLDGSGKATYTTSTLAVGPHTIVVSYLGNSNFNGSTSPTFTQTVGKSNTATTLASSNTSAVYGEAVITATVAATGSGGGTPTGTVLFHISGLPDRSATLDPNTGKATLPGPALNVGTYAITADYTGSGSYGASSSNTLNQTVVRADTATVVSSSSPNAVYGQAVITATVTANSPSTGVIPNGSVTFHISGQADRTATLDANTGKATLPAPALDVGTYIISATYNQSGNFNSSNSANLSQTVTPAATSTTVTSSNNPSVLGQMVTFTATVTAPAPGSGTPTGSVIFTVDGVNQAPVALSGGKATYSTNSFGLGNHTIKATYGGSTNFSGSASATFTQNVNQTPSFPTLIGGDGQAFGLDNAGNLWRYRASDNSYTSANFTARSLTVVNVGDGNAANDLAFVVGTDNNIWYWNGQSLTAAGGRAPGPLVAGDNQVFFVGFDSQVWLFNVQNGWRQSGGYGASLVVGSVGDGVASNDVVFLKGSDSKIWYWTHGLYFSWTGGYLRTIVPGDNQVFGIGYDNQIWRYRVSGDGAGWLQSGGYATEIIVGNTGDSNPNNDLVWDRVGDNSLWLWTQTTWQNLNQKVTNMAAGDYQLFAVDSAGQLMRFLTGPSGGWKSSGFFGSKVTVGNPMDDFAADDIAFLTDASGRLQTWKP